MNLSITYHRIVFSAGPVKAWSTNHGDRHTLLLHSWVILSLLTRYNDECLRRNQSNKKRNFP